MLLSLWLFLSGISAASDVQDITAALHEHHFEAALALSNVALKNDSTNPVLLTLKGLAEAGQGNEEEALASYLSAVQSRPNYLPALQGEAEIEFHRKDPRCGLTLQHVLAINPKNPVAHAMQGAIAYAQHNCSQAIVEYEQSASVIQTQPSSLTQYGECLVHQGQHEAAIVMLTKALQLMPDRWEVRYNLGVANLLNGQAADSLLVLQPALQSRQAPSQVLDLASAAYEQEGDTPKSVAVLRSAIVSFPDTAALYLHFADLCFAHQSFQIGIEMLGLGLKRLPKAAPLYIARGILLVQIGQYQLAQKDFEKAAELDPTQSSSSVALGLTQMQQDNLDDALRITKKKLQQNASDAYLNYLLAEILRRRGAEVGTPEFKDAQTAVQRAIFVQPNFPLALDLSGDLYLRSGQVPQAIAQFQKVLTAEPANQSALYHLIIASRRSGNEQQIPQLMKRLADAKTAQKQSDDRTNRYVFVHPSGNQ